MYNKLANKSWIMYSYYIQIWGHISSAIYDLHQDTWSWNKRSQRPFAYFKNHFDDFVISWSFKSCQFLHTRLNFCSINNKIDEHFKQLKFIKENSSLYDAVDAPLEYYSKCVSVLQCAWSMEFSQRFHLATELLLDADIKI